jgi:dimethylargininase
VTPLLRPGLSYRFSDAIARCPGRSVVRGIRAIDRGPPDFERFLSEHRTYLEAVERAGVKVTLLDALEEFPDSVFIEDDALCLPEAIVMLRPGAPSRTGESWLLASTLRDLSYEVVRCDAAGYIDGGDILITDSTILVGLSGRTDRQGYDWLRAVLGQWDYSVQAVQIPQPVLHLKSECSVLDSETVLATRRLAATQCFAAFRVLPTPEGEEQAANLGRINDTVLVPAGFPATAELIAREGHTVETVPVTQASLLDGGLTCMSLRVPAVAVKNLI